jgi:hypothetical protein
MALAHAHIDAETMVLIARLNLTDIEQVELSQKGKGRSDLPPTDAQLALQAQAKAFEDTIRDVEDYILACSLDRALQSDHGYLVALDAIERGEREDHQSALALSQGNPLSPPSRFQQTLETISLP